MSSHLVGGVRLPDAVGGHPALDFCNTRAGWGTLAPKEYLASPRALVLWAVDAGVLPVAVGDVPAEPDGGPPALRRALALREELYACALGRGTEPGWRLLSAEIAAARAAGHLTPAATDDGRAGWVLPAPDPANPAGPSLALLALHAVADAAEDLLTAAAGTAVAACPGEGCGWLFTDARRRRRWCSMAVCGNRAKARRFAATRGARTGGP